MTDIQVSPTEYLPVIFTGVFGFLVSLMFLISAESYLDFGLNVAVADVSRRLGSFGASLGLPETVHNKGTDAADLRTVKIVMAILAGLLSSLMQYPSFRQARCNISASRTTQATSFSNLPFVARGPDLNLHEHRIPSPCFRVSAFYTVFFRSQYLYRFRHG